MRILQVSAEIFPLLKTGGLADVAAALPLALNRVGGDVRVLLPGFPAVLAGLSESAEVARFVSPWGDTVQVNHGLLPALADADNGAPLHAYVLVAPHLFDRPGNPYEDAQRLPYADNHRRFATLCWAAARLAHGLDAHWRPQLVHSHDWHAGLTPAMLLHWQGPHVPSVYTVHNLAYQGLFGAQHFAELGLPPSTFQAEGLEFYGQVSFMKAGLYYADHITTVSPTYAQEIQTPDQGCGLDGLLRKRATDLSGILNGVDDAVWNPATDREIPHAFDRDHMAGKAACKQALQRELGLADAPDAPLFAVVSRLTEQKGLPLVLQAAHLIIERGGQLLVLGSGDRELEQGFTALAQAHPTQVAVYLGYNEPLAHRVFAGSDVTLVPSRFEPCGLTQLYGLKYGSLPLVRRVGGLADTVVDTDLATLDDGSATGVVFDAFDTASLSRALLRAFALYKRRPDWDRVRHTAMSQRFDWTGPAQAYMTLYRDLTAGV
jgi:starch synthase